MPYPGPLSGCGAWCSTYFKVNITVKKPYPEHLSDGPAGGCGAWCRTPRSSGWLTGPGGPPPPPADSSVPAPPPLATEHRSIPLSINQSNYSIITDINKKLS